MEESGARERAHIVLMSGRIQSEAYHGDANVIGKERTLCYSVSLQ
jgi:hypothetical protein